MSCLVDGKKSVIHGLETRVKIISFTIFVALAVSLNSVNTLFAALAVVLLLGVLGKIAAGKLVRRLLLVLPFECVILFFIPFTVEGREVFGLWGLTVTAEGLRYALVIFLRMETACVIMTVLFLTTGTAGMINGLKGLHFPEIIVGLMEFILRYIDLFNREIEKMNRARESRGYVRGRHIFSRRTFKTMGDIIGMGVVRSYDRSIKIYNAMLSRGYTGDTAGCRCRAVRVSDLFLSVCFVITAVALFIVDRGIII
jgi:cobalt/nickel transport system permease protein